LKRARRRACFQLPVPLTAAPLRLYLGTSTSEGGPGILSAAFDPATGTLGELQLVSEVRQPGFFAWHPGRPVLYSTMQTGGEGDAAGAVIALAVDPATGRLTEINRQATGTAFPVHLAVTPDGRHLLTCSYAGAAAVVLPLATDGAIGPAGTVLRFTGSSVHPLRQTRAYPHSINPTPDGRHVFLCDLGADTIIRFTRQPDGSLQRLDPAVRASSPGAGPRHLRFSADGRAAYLVNELANTLTVYACHASSGGLTERQSLPLLPDDFHGEHTAAEVRIHPNGRYVYVSTRGHSEPRLDCLVVFRADPMTNRLQFVQRVPTGHHPRHFNLDPSGRWLLVAARESDRLEFFAIDPDTGRLHPHGQPVSVRRPLNLKFFPATA
jgi:6-phosphogluconolactonase